MGSNVGIDPPPAAVSRRRVGRRRQPGLMPVRQQQWQLGAGHHRAGGPDAEGGDGGLLGLVLGAEWGVRLHLAHPLGNAGHANRRVKNDIADATLLADLL